MEKSSERAGWKCHAFSLSEPNRACLACSKPSSVVCPECKSCFCSDACQKIVRPTCCRNKNIQLLSQYLIEHVPHALALEACLTETHNFDEIRRVGLGCFRLANGMVQFGVILNGDVVRDFSRSMTPPDVDASGCGLAFPLIGLVCANKDMISGEMLAMLDALNSRKVPGKKLCYMAVLEPLQMEPRYHDQSLQSHMRNGLIDSVYWVRMIDTLEKPLHEHYKTADDAWSGETKGDAPGSSHELLILVIGDEMMILQAYFGHYTFKQWAKFNEPLRLGIDKRPINPMWKRQVLERPRFRGPLKGDERFELAKALDSLTINGNARYYADITGIQHTNEGIARKFQLKYVCLRLDGIRFN